MPSDAYIFDLDGTLLDTEVLWVTATEDFLRDRQCPLTHADALDIVYGKSWHDVYRRISDRFPLLAMSLPEMQEAMDPYFRRLRDTRDVRLPGSIDLLKRLADRSPVCLVSGSSRHDVEAAIAMMDVAACLAFSLASEDYSPGKPDPACYRLAAERLSVSPAGCTVFEDSAAGVAAAKAAGMHCVALARDGMPLQDVSAADLVLPDLSQFSDDASL